MKKDLKIKIREGRSDKLAQLVMEVAAEADDWLLRTHIRRTSSKMLSCHLNNVVEHTQKTGE